MTLFFFFPVEWASENVDNGSRKKSSFLHVQLPFLRLREKIPIRQVFVLSVVNVNTPAMVSLLLNPNEQLFFFTGFGCLCSLSMYIVCIYVVREAVQPYIYESAFRSGFLLMAVGFSPEISISSISKERREKNSRPHSYRGT